MAAPGSAARPPKETPEQYQERLSKEKPDEKFDRDKFNDKGFVVMPPVLFKLFDAVKGYLTGGKKTEIANAKDLQARSAALGDIKAHDMTTFQHSIRTGNLGARLGEWMGIEQGRIPPTGRRFEVARHRQAEGQQGHADGHG